MELEIRDLSKRYGKKTAVRDVNLTITPGVWGLIGANGAGKTTLMRMLTGILTPSSGRVLCDGIDTSALGEAYRDALGYLPQSFGFYPEFNVVDYLEYVATLKGLGRRAYRGRIDELLELLSQFLPEGPQLFPEDMVTDQPERQVCAEIIREKLLLCLDKEIPHGTAVEITTFSERDDGIIDLDATIYCEKASHKGIIIGKGGAMLKKISTLARTDIEAFMGTKVFLQTWVKVKENWRDNMNLIKNFGYRDE